MARTVRVSVHDECEHGVACSWVREFETVEDAMEWLDNYDNAVEETDADDVIEAFDNLYDAIADFNFTWWEFAETLDTDREWEFVDDVDCAITSLINAVGALGNVLWEDADD